jgi:hypothetical protein
MHPNLVNYLGHVYIQYMPKLLEREYETNYVTKFKSIFECTFFHVVFLNRINSIIGLWELLELFNFSYICEKIEVVDSHKNCKNHPTLISAMNEY